MAPPHASRVYADAMNMLREGHALWSPEPGEGGPPEIGDVGYFGEYGGFRRLFNVVSLSRDRAGGVVMIDRHLPNQPPPTFNVFDASPYYQQEENALKPKVYPSSKVKSTSYGAEGNVIGGGGAAVRYTCDNDQGAIMDLGSSAHRQWLEHRRMVRDFVRRNYYKFWQPFVQEHLDVPDDFIVFVSGCMRTNGDWILSAFSSSGSAWELDAAAEGSIGGGRIHARRAVHLEGPVVQREGRLVRQPGTTENEPRDTLFIKYYGYKRLGPFPRLKAAAGPHVIPVDRNQDDTMEGIILTTSEDDLDRIDDSAPLKDPLQYLLDYILENSEAEAAIGCIDDLYILLPDEEWPSDLEAYLSQLKPDVDVDDEKVGSISDSMIASVLERQRGTATTKQQSSAHPSLSALFNPPKPVQWLARRVQGPQSEDNVRKAAAAVSNLAQKAASHVRIPGLAPALMVLVEFLKKIQARSTFVKGIGALTQDVELLVESAADLSMHNPGTDTLEALQETIVELTSNWDDIRDQVTKVETQSHIERFLRNTPDAEKAEKVERLVQKIRSALKCALLHVQRHGSPIGLDTIILQSSDHEILDSGELDSEESLQPWVTRSLRTLISEWKVAYQQSVQPGIIQAPFSFRLAERIIILQKERNKLIWPRGLDADARLDMYHSIILAVAVSKDAQAARLAAELYVVGFHLLRTFSDRKEWPPSDADTLHTAFLAGLEFTSFTRSTWKEKWSEWLAPDQQPPHFLEVTIPLMRAWLWAWDGGEDDVFGSLQEICDAVFSGRDNLGLTSAFILDLVVLCRILGYSSDYLGYSLDTCIKARFHAYTVIFRLLRSCKSESCQAKCMKLRQRMVDERILLAHWFCRAHALSSLCNRDKPRGWEFLRRVVVSKQMKREYRRREETPAVADSPLGVAGGSGTRLEDYA